MRWSMIIYFKRVFAFALLNLRIFHRNNEIQIWQLIQIIMIQSFLSELFHLSEVLNGWIPTLK